MHDMANRTRSEIGRSSKEKGKRGEREAAELFRDHGFDVRRSVQYNGRRERLIWSALPACTSK